MLQLHTLEEVQAKFPPQDHRYPWAASRAAILRTQAMFTKTGNALKELYCTRKRFPEAAAALNHIGACYWAQSVPPFIDAVKLPSDAAPVNTAASHSLAVESGPAHSAVDASPSQSAVDGPAHNPEVGEQGPASKECDSPA